MNLRETKTSLLIICLLLVSGCDSKDDIPNIGNLYTDLAKEEDPNRNPVIVIPGVLGSRLIDPATGIIAWGKIGKSLENPKEAEEVRLIALPIDENKTFSDLRDKMIADRALDRLILTVYGVTVELNTYSDILSTLGVGGFRKEELDKSNPVDYGNQHYTSFQFAYDWRRDLVEAAKQLHKYVLEKRAYVQKEIEQRHGIKNKDVKFNIVAHSMGGLVTRYYLRYGDVDLPEDGSLPPVTWKGSKYIEQVVLIGTPNAGSVNGFRQLVEGTQLGPGLPSFEPAILGTMPALYQLLPRGRHGHLVNGTNSVNEFLDPHDPALWQRMGWGLADPDKDHILQILLPDIKDQNERSRIAREYQQKALHRAKAFATALDIPASPPKGLFLNLIAGDAVDTLDVIKVNTENGALEEYKTGPGDGKVLRSSALSDERVGAKIKGRLRTPIDWANVLFLFSDHLGLTKDPVFTDNILYILLEQPLDHRG